MGRREIKANFAQGQQGAALLEALIAILLFSLGILALAGLQAAMIKNTDDAKYRSEATFVAQEMLGNIWISGASDLSSKALAEQSFTQLPNGKRSIAVSADRVVTVTVKWTLPGKAEHTYVTSARIEGIGS
ncbi:MAG: prepilin-type cleavage/methylation domain-containing protein [Methylophilus sp.]|jgi:type IV pilus assembly protein PilV